MNARLLLHMLRSALVVGLSMLVVSGTALPADPPYDINIILSVTGQAAFIGKLDQDTFAAFETMINKRGGVRGRPIHFVIADDQSSPQVAVQLANGLLAKNVNVVLGPNFTGTCRAVEPLIPNGPVEYCLSPGPHPDKGSYGYSASTSTTDMIAVALRYFHQRGWKRIALLSTTDATGQDGDASFAQWLAAPENKELTLVSQEHFNVSDISASAQMARIKAAQPQVVVLWVTGSPMGTALRAFSEAGLDVPVYVTNSNLTTTQTHQFKNVIPKQYYSAAPGFVANIAPSPASKREQTAYYGALSAAGIPNDYTAGIVWDPALLVVSALQRLGTNATAAQINDYLQHLTGFAGISGTYDFTDGGQRGLGQKDIMVMRYDADKDVWLPMSGFGAVGNPPKR